MSQETTVYLFAPAARSADDTGRAKIVVLAGDGSVLAEWRIKVTALRIEAPADVKLEVERLK